MVQALSVLIYFTLLSELLHIRWGTQTANQVCLCFSNGQIRSFKEASIKFVFENKVESTFSSCWDSCAKKSTLQYMLSARLL